MPKPTPRTEVYPFHRRYPGMPDLSEEGADRG